MGLNIAFWLLAGVAIIAALGVVVMRNAFRAALAFILCLLAVAGIFVTLSADFLAVIQVLVYIGAISVIIILAIMLTREFQHGNPSNKLRAPALIVAVLFLGAVSFALLNTHWQIAADMPSETTTLGLAKLLFSENGFILPLEIAPVLLLAAILGAMVLAREK